MSFIVMILFILGLALLIVGAELLVRGASRLAAVLNISPIVIGLTVVSYGTSSPELAVSVRSSLAGQPDIALGNVVGSNIFNVLFILGLSALITPLTVVRQLVRMEVPLMVGASVLLFILALDGSISRADGLLLFTCIVIYTIFAIRQSRMEQGADPKGYAPVSTAQRHESKKGLFLQAAFILAGLAMLTLGSRWLVNGAVELARFFGISELIIGLTIVAAGTSLPEVATSVIASLRGERDIAVGNVVGSNIFNIFAVLGLSSLFSPDGVKVAPAAMNFDIPVMTASALACLPIFFTGYKIARWEGALFFSYYIIYILYLFLDAEGHAALPAFSAVMLKFVLPLTIVTLMVLLMQGHRQQKD